MIRHGKKKSRTGWTATIAFAMAAALALPLSVSRAQAGGQTQPEGRPVLSEADKKTQVRLDAELPDQNFQGDDLADVIDTMREVAGLNIIVNWRQFEEQGVGRNTKIVLKLVSVTTSEALDAILAEASGKDHKLSYRIDDGIIDVVLLLPADKQSSSRHLPKAADKVTQALLDGIFPEMNCDAVALSDVIDYLVTITGMKIDVDWNNLESIGVTKDSPVTFKLKDAKVSQVLSVTLECVADPAKFDVKAGKGVITVSAREPDALDLPELQSDKPIDPTTRPNSH